MYLMHRDKVAAEVEVDHKNRPIGIKTIIDENEMPVGVFSRNKQTMKLLFDSWLKSRSVPEARPNLQQIEKKLGKAQSDFFMQNAGVSLTDGYFFSENKNAILWKDINFHNNGFDETFLQIKLDLWKKGIKSPDFTTDGMMEKFWTNNNGTPYLIKMDNIHHDLLCANEVFYFHAAQMLKINAVPYFHGEFSEKKDGKQVKYCTCPSFVVSPNEDFVNALQVRHAESNLSNGKSLILYFKNELGFDKEIREMLTLDCILHNTDRHEKNFGYIKSINGEIRMASLYDNGTCLGVNNIFNENITDKDMKLLRDSRYGILRMFGMPVSLDEQMLISDLQETYELFDIEEKFFQKAVLELKKGIGIYQQAIDGNKIIIGEKQNGKK